MPHVLIAEDDAALREIIAEALTDAHFTPDEAATARDARFKLKTNAYDLAIIDWGFRGEEMSGIDLIRELGDDGTKTPVLMLTGRGTLMDRMTGFRTGVDDYLTKPFYIPELIARVTSVIRRSQGEAPTKKVVTVDNIVIDLRTFTVHVGDKYVPLNHRQFQLFLYLAERRGQVVSRTEIFEKIWGDNDARTLSNTIDVHVSRLRIQLGKKIGKRIVCIRGTGYRFD